MLIQPAHHIHLPCCFDDLGDDFREPLSTPLQLSLADYHRECTAPVRSCTSVLALAHLGDSVSVVQPAMDFYPSSARLSAKLTPVRHTGDDAHVARHDHSVSACCRSLKRVLSSVRFSKSTGASGEAETAEIVVNPFQRMLTARAARKATTIKETIASSIISPFAVRVSGMVSAGLRAVAVVKATKR